MKLFTTILTLLIINLQVGKFLFTNATMEITEQVVNVEKTSCSIICTAKPSSTEDKCEKQNTEKSENGCNDPASCLIGNCCAQYMILANKLSYSLFNHTNHLKFPPTYSENFISGFINDCFHPPQKCLTYIMRS